VSRRGAALAALGAAALGLAVVAAVLGPRLLAPAADAAGASLPGRQAVLTRAAFVPNVHLFGDPVEARLQVAVDRRRIDPDTVEVEWDFSPYEVVGERRVERRDAGDVTVLAHVVTLRCLGLDCVPPRLQSDAGEQEAGRGERHAFTFPAVRVDFRGGPELEPRSVRWPALEVVSRINAAAYAATFEEQQWTALGPAVPFAHGLDPVAASYRLDPRLLASAALGGAALLLLVPAVTLAGAVRRRRRTPSERWALLPPRERARLLALWAVARDDPDERRRALELAAAELGGDGEETLAAQARELAWAGEAPRADAVVGLAESLNGGGRRRAR
jgi:hypothetical protein